MMPNINTPETERIKWHGHIRRREEENLSRQMMVIPKKRRGQINGDGFTTPGKI